MILPSITLQGSRREIPRALSFQGRRISMQSGRLLYPQVSEGLIKGRKDLALAAPSLKKRLPFCKNALSPFLISSIFVSIKCFLLWGFRQFQPSDMGFSM